MSSWQGLTEEPGYYEAYPAEAQREVDKLKARIAELERIIADAQAAPDAVEAAAKVLAADDPACHWRDYTLQAQAALLAANLHNAKDKP